MFQNSTRYNSTLASYFSAKSLISGDYKKVIPNIRKIQELGWQLTILKNWQALHTQLKNLSFLKLVALYFKYDVHNYWSNLEQNSSLSLAETYKSIIENPSTDLTAAHIVDNLLGHHGHIERAIDLRRELVEHYQRTQDDRNLANALLNLGSAYEEINESQRALTAYNRAIQLAEKIGNIHVLLNGLNHSLTLLIDKGDLDLALAYSEHALRISRSTRDLEMRATLLLNQGIAFYLKGNKESARKNFIESRTIYNNLEEYDGYQKATGELGILEMEFDTLKAMNYLKEQEKICRKFNILKSLAICIGNQASVESLNDNPGEAIKLWQEQTEISHKISYYSGVCSSIIAIAEVYFRRAIFKEAEELVDHVIALGREADVKEPLDKALVFKGHFLAYRGKIDHAKDLYNEAVKRNMEYSLPYKVAQLCCLVGDYLVFFVLKYQADGLSGNEWTLFRNTQPISQLNDYPGLAIGFYQKAIDISPSHSHAYEMMGIAYELSNNIDKAIDSYNKARNLENKQN